MSEPTPDHVTTSNGTEFAVFSEQVRGEPRFYWIERRDVGQSAYRTDGEYDGSYDRRTIMRRFVKRVREWEHGEKDA